MTSPNRFRPGTDHWTESARLARLRELRRNVRRSLPNLQLQLEDAESLRGQIENYIGIVRVPVGIAGPIEVRGANADGAFHVPLATTEGTLVLAVSRGAEAMNRGGGAHTFASRPRISRAPLFAFSTGAEARAAAEWAVERVDRLREIVATQTRHGQLVSVEPVLYGRRLVLECVFDTADAAGQNMVTFAAAAICQWLRAQAPFAKLADHAIETNVSQDKKMTALSVRPGRGRRVEAEAVMPREVVRRVLGASPDQMARIAREGAYASLLSGGIGAQAQFANVLSAILLATGQDVATVVESGTGLTVMEATAAGDLYASVTIPNLVLGTVGGGTRLPSQLECLTLMECAGSGCAQRFAEITGAAVLAGELALVASLASDSFARAHAALGRPA